MPLLSLGFIAHNRFSMCRTIYIWQQCEHKTQPELSVNHVLVITHLPSTNNNMTCLAVCYFTSGYAGKVHMWAAWKFLQWVVHEMAKSHYVCIWLHGDMFWPSLQFVIWNCETYLQGWFIAERKIDFCLDRKDGIRNGRQQRKCLAMFEKWLTKKNQSRWQQKCLDFHWLCAFVLTHRLTFSTKQITADLRPLQSHLGPR